MGNNLSLKPSLKYDIVRAYGLRVFENMIFLTHHTGEPHGLLGAQVESVLEIGFSGMFRRFSIVNLTRKAKCYENQIYPVRNF